MINVHAPEETVTVCDWNANQNQLVKCSCNAKAARLLETGNDIRFDQRV